MQGSTIFKRFIYANGKGKKIDALNDVAVSKDDSGDEKKLWNSKWLENQTGFYTLSNSPNFAKDRLNFLSRLPNQKQRLPHQTMMVISSQIQCSTLNHIDGLDEKSVNLQPLALHTHRFGFSAFAIKFRIDFAFPFCK